MLPRSLQEQEVQTQLLDEGKRKTSFVGVVLFIHEGDNAPLLVLCRCL